MNYKEWLEKTIGDMLKEKNEKISLKVYEQSNARYDGGVYDCTIVINGLGGTTDADIEVVPIQLMCLSGGQIEVDEEGNTAYDIFYEVLKEFCKEYNFKSVLLNDFDYYKNNYLQPYPINPMEQDSGTFRLNFVISGNLTISREINDIKEIHINDEPIRFMKATLSYITQLSSSKKINQKLNRNRVETSGLRLNLGLYNRNNMIERIARGIRKEELKPNTSLNVKIIFSNDEIEEYSCILSECSITADRINPSDASYVFDLY